MILEVAANAVTTLSIWLAVKNSIHTWTTGIVGCILFLILFYTGQLYGEKSIVDDKKLSINATAFLIKWSDVQTEHYLTCSYAYTENEGEVQSTGGELELAYRVRADLTLGLNGSYTHAVADGALPNVNALSGEQTPFTPRYLGSATAEYVYGFIKFNAEYSYHGSSGTRFNPTDMYYRELPSYSNVNVGANVEQNNWQYGLFVRNLMNSNQVTMIMPNELAPAQPGDEIAHNRPRTIGVRVAIVSD
jgi:hypothetical protein